MVKQTCFFKIVLVAICLLCHSCSDDSPTTEPAPTPTPDPTPPETFVDGFNYNTSILDADQPVTITFKAPSGTALHGSTEDMYLYSGVGTNWEGAPGNWTDNSVKYKMTAVTGQSNTWTITLSSSIRSYYNLSDNTPIQVLNLIVRNADGNKQTGDYSVLVQDSKNGFTLKETDKQSMPVAGVNPEGVHINSASSATFVFYDYSTTGKHKDYAYIIGHFSDWKLKHDYQMKYDDTKHCWWITLEGLTPGETAFQYYVYSTADGGSYLCEPYSEKVLEKNVASNFPTKAAGQYVSIVNTQPEVYNWENTSFKVMQPEGLVIYEMLLRDFTSAHHLEGAKGKLPYLKAMGINAIELMPVQEFDGKDSWGYNTSFYFALDDSYGSMKQYKEFVDACHKEGMAVIFDVVYNHTNNNNPFAKLYWDFHNNRPSPTNPWLNAETPHQKYIFSTDDFNHSSEQTRNFVKRNLKYLLNTYHIDGFRFDFTKGFTQKKTIGDEDLAAYDADRVAVLKEYYDAVKAVKSDAIVIMEHFSDSEESTLAPQGICFWRNMNYAYMQSAMGWNESSSFDRLYEPTAPTRFVGFMESHDEERMGYKQMMWGNETLKTDLAARMKQLATNATFFLTVPGPKMIWQFGELGYDYSINSDEAGKTVSEEYRTARKPIRWDYFNDSQRKGLYDVYAQLIDLRNAHPELFDGTAAFSWKVGVSDWNKGRTLIIESISGKKLVALGNFTNATASVNFPSSAGNWKNYFTGKSEMVTESLSVPANNFVLYTNF